MNVLRRSLLIVCLVISFSMDAVSNVAVEKWTQSGFQEFSRGTFSGAGLNIYVSSKGRIQLINRLDLNNDGKIDIVIANGHAHTEKEDVFIYPNRGGDFDERNRIEIPTDGARALAIADLDRDGKNDLVIAHNDNGITSRLNAFIYYGTAGGYTASRRKELPAFSSNGVITGDFNGDSWIDIAFACQNETGKGTVSTVYWNSPSGFDVTRKQDYSSEPLLRLATADWDGDGVADVLAVTAKSVLVFVGGPQGLRLQQTNPGGGTDIALGDFDRNGKVDYAVINPGEVSVYVERNKEPKPLKLGDLNLTSGITTADFNQDGLLDLAVAQRNINGNEYTDSIIIWNGAKGLDSKSRTKLPTVAATSVAAADLNGDGFPEVVFANQHAYNELNIQSFVYWNSRGEFYPGRKSMLDTRGVMRVTIGDIDNDKRSDLVFANRQGGWSAGWSPNFIYWGDGTRNYSTARRTDIPSYYTTGSVQADLDDDGWVDLGFNEGRYAEGKPDTLHGMYVWWGSPKGYSENKRSVLSVKNPEGGAKVADLNRDGYLDLIIGGADNNGEGKGGFVVLWGSVNGYSAQNKQVFHTGGMCRAPLVADLNGDGYLDLAGAPYSVNGLFVFWGSKDGFNGNQFTLIAEDRNVSYPEAADMNNDGVLDLVLPTRKFGDQTEADSFIYYGSKSGFSDDRRTGLPTMAAYDPSVADLNKDGWLDVVMPNYSATMAAKRTLPTYIYWGSKDGFNPQRRQELPADSGAGSMIADFDGDGWLDLFVVSHRKDGSRDEAGKPHVHQANSLIYWNGPRGFQPQLRTELPSVGAHAQIGVDNGNIMTRELAEYYTSPPHRSQNEQARAQQISWEATTPAGTSVAFQVRSAASEQQLPTAPWIGANGRDSSWHLKSGSPIVNAQGPWIQYRARLTTSNGGPTPYLLGVSVIIK